MSKLLIHNARLVDPETETDQLGSLLIERENIVEFGFVDNSGFENEDIKKIDAQGHVVTTGLCDIFVGVGEPSGKHIETIDSLSKAALASGITTIALDPNTNPVLDNPAAIDYLRNNALKQSPINFFISASMTEAMEGNKIVGLSKLKKLGITSITHGDEILDNSLILRRIMSYASSQKMVVALMTGDKNLYSDGCANEGFVSTLYGLPPISESAEYLGLMRDILLARETKASLHIRGISSKKSLELLKTLKIPDDDITISVSAQHILLNENDIIPYKTFLKMRPPLREEEDRVSLIEGLISGDIDMVYSQHCPRHSDSKRLPFAEADYGCSSIETLLPVILSLYHNQYLSLAKALKLVTVNPAKRFGLGNKSLKRGGKADLIFIDLDYSYKFNKDEMISKSNNTAFDGHIFQGKCMKTFIKGQCVYEA